MMKKTLFLCSIVLACGGDDNQTTDGGQDATTSDASKDAVADTTTQDAKADVASDAPVEASNDAGIDAIADASSDVALDVAVDSAGGGCDGGCTKYSFECSNAKPACQCIGLAAGEKAPVCDAGPANCFVDPCQTKSVQCIANQCVIQ